jgi:hypothetical protein
MGGAVARQVARTAGSETLYYYYYYYYYLRSSLPLSHLPPDSYVYAEGHPTFQPIIPPRTTCGRLKSFYSLSQRAQTIPYSA